MAYLNLESVSYSSLQTSDGTGHQRDDDQESLVDDEIAAVSSSIQAMKLDRSKGRKCSGCSTIVKVLTVALLVIIVLIAALVTVTVLNRRSDHNKNCTTPEIDDRLPLCLSTECVKTAGEMLSRMDQDTDPCQNFYQYACGAFTRPENRPPEMPLVSTDTEAQLKIIRQLMPLLNSSDMEYRSKPSSAVRKLKEYFAVCMNDTAGYDDLLQDIYYNLKPLHPSKEWRHSKKTARPTFVSQTLVDALKYGFKTSNWQSCTLLAIEKFGLAAGALYAEKYLEAGDLDKLSNALNVMKDEFVKALPTIDWLTGYSRAMVKQIPKAILLKIGIPEAYNDLKKLDEYYNDLKITNSLSTNNRNIEDFNRSHRRPTWISEEYTLTEWPEPLEVNAFYTSTRTGLIVIPAGIMQKPFYDRNWPLSLFYGGIGSVLGHELFHAFGALQETSIYGAKEYSEWLDENSIVEYNIRSKCFQRHYEELKFYGYNVSYKLSADENNADNGGISVAYKAFRRASQKGKTQLLPALNLTAPRQFFLAYAQGFCVNANDENAKIFLYDTHAPPLHRVNVVLRNMPEFSEAFNCPLNTVMNPKDKCKLW